MVYIRRAVMIMEPPSPASMERRDVIEREKLGGGTALGKRKRGEDDGKIRKQKKGPKEPNPLSVKKKKPLKESARTKENKEERERNEGDNTDLEGYVDTNIIGDITDSLRRLKSTRRRRHHHHKSLPNENQ